MSTTLQAKQILFILAAFLPRIGQPDLAAKATIVEESHTEHTILLGDTGIGIDTGYGIAVRLGQGVTVREGFRVFQNETFGGRTSPEETVDRTICVSLGVDDVLKAVAMLLGDQATRNLPDLPAELQENVIAEEVW